MDPSNSNSCEIAGALIHKRRQRAHFTVVSAVKQSITDHKRKYFTSWWIHDQAELQRLKPTERDFASPPLNPLPPTRFPILPAPRLNLGFLTHTPTNTQ